MLFRSDSAHSLWRKSASEAGEGAMIWRRLIKRNSQKLLEGYSIVDLGLQFRIGVKAEPLLEKEAFQEQKRGIGFIPFAAFSDRIISDQYAVYSGPIDSGIDLFHSADGAVTIQRVEKGDVGKGEVRFHFLEAHSSSRCMNLKKLWQKYEQMSSNSKIISTCCRLITAFMTNVHHNKNKNLPCCAKVSD